MPNKLFLKPKSPDFNTESIFDWALYDLTGEQLKNGQPSTLEVIDQTLMQNGIEEARVILIWPSDWALSSKVTIPGNQTRYIQQALPFVIEDQVAQDIERLHFSIGTKDRNGQYPVISIDYALFESCVELIDTHLETASLYASYVDAELLPLAASNLAVFLGHDSALVHADSGQLIRLDVANIVTFLDILLAERDEDATSDIRVIEAQDSVSAMLIAELQQLQNVEILTQSTALTELEILAEGYFAEGSKSIDLCQADFKVNLSTQSHWKKWRVVAVIAGLGFLLQLGVFVGKGMYYQQQADMVAQQALTQYQKLVPGSSKISAARLPRILKGKLNQSRNMPAQNTDFLSLLGEAGHQFSQSQNKTKLAFKSITYNQQRGELVMEMQANSFEQLEALKKSIVSAGLGAKISSAVQEDNYFRGRISVSGS